MRQLYDRLFSKMDEKDKLKQQEHYDNKKIRYVKPAQWFLLLIYCWNASPRHLLCEIPLAQRSRVLFLVLKLLNIDMKSYRLTITGLNVKPLEATCSQIINSAKDHEFKVKGPGRIPTKCLKITTRKSPCGEGTNTWDRFEMRIHKRVIDIYCPSSVVKDITTFKIDPSVDVNLVVFKQWASWKNDESVCFCNYLLIFMFV